MMNLDEGLIDVLFDKVIYNIRVISSGNNVEFKVYLPGSKTAMSLRVRKTTVKKFKMWFDNIYKDIDGV